jgi:glycosyltransferase involved in cell wall biosynthesis
MKKLKILIICDIGFLHGGSEITVMSQKKELIILGHEVRIFSSDISQFHNVYEGEHFNDYGFPGFNENTVIGLINQIFNFRSYFALKKVLKEFKPDIVHLFNIYYQVSPSILKCLKNIPTVMKICSNELICTKGAVPAPDVICNYKFGEKQCLKCVGSRKGYYYERIRQKVYNSLLRNVDVFLAPSKSVKNNFKNHDVINNKIIVVYDGIELLKYSEIENTETILFVGRLSQEKGAEYLLRAMPLILKKQPRARCDIVGDGPERERLEQLTDELKINKHVNFFGRVPYERIEDSYRRAAVVVIPSICSEAFSLVGVEAMSVGRPVVGTNLGAIPEWLEDGKTGFLVEPGDPEDIADKIIKLLADPKLNKMMGKRARERAEQFTLEEYGVNLEELYEKILKKYV